MSLSLKHFYRFTLIVFGLFTAANAWALQISQPVLMSRLGEPLRLQFIVTEVSASEEQLLTLAVAEPKIYESTQIKRVSGLDNISFEITKQANGNYLVLATGSQPMVDEYADLVIDFDWATGRRFINIGLNIKNAPPPAASMATTPPAQAVNQPLGPAPASPDTSAATDVSHTPVTETAPTAATVSETEHTNTATPATSSAADTPDPMAASTPLEVKKGDTASKLLMGLVNPDISLDQLLLAMLQQNPKAFVNNNVNRLKAGALVTLPKPSDAAIFDRQQAREDIRLQAADFQAYRASLAATASLAPQTQGSQRESSGKLKADVVTPANAPADQLTLSKPGDTEAEKIAKQLQTDESARQSKEVSDNLSQLSQLSQAASQFNQGVAGRFPGLSASYEQGMAWAQRHMFELIAGVALFAAFLVSFSLKRESRRQADHSSADIEHQADDDTQHRADENTPQDDPNRQNLHLPPDLTLDLDDSPAKPLPDLSSNPTPADHTRAFPVDNTSPVIQQGEDPFVMRLELADELWKLGQKQTALALAQEVADQTHGETRDMAQRWLKDRS